MHLFEDIPWSEIGSFLTVLTLLTAIVGPKFKFVRKWIGAGLQEMLGVTRLQELMSTEVEARAQMHVQNQRQFRELKSQIVEVSQLAAEVAVKADERYKEAEKHYTDTNVHIKESR